MLKLKKDEVNWQLAKLQDSGAKGMVVKYSHLHKAQGRTFIKTITEENDIPPHDDVRNIFDRFRPIIVRVESMDYARVIVDTPGFEPTNLQLQLTQAAVAQEMSRITVTEIAIHEKKNEKGIVFKYDKTDSANETTGHKTAWIGTGDTIYGVEEELEELLEELIIELYGYVFDEKYADFEQLTMDMD